MDDAAWYQETSRRAHKALTTPKQFGELMDFVQTAQNVEDLVLKLPDKSPLRERCELWGEESMRRLRIVSHLFKKVEYQRIQRFITNQVS